jgi:hypothetical protein
VPGHVTPNLCFCIWWDLQVTYCVPVCPGREQSMHIFSFSDWTGTDLTKKCTETQYTDLEFVHPMGSAGHVVQSGTFGPQNVDVLFFMLGWDRYGFNKKRVRTHYAELVFLHLIEFRYVRHANCRRIIFHTRVARCS